MLWKRKKKEDSKQEIVRLAELQARIKREIFWRGYYKAAYDNFSKSQDIDEINLDTGYEYLKKRVGNIYELYLMKKSLEGDNKILIDAVREFECGLVDGKKLCLSNVYVKHLALAGDKFAQKAMHIWTQRAIEVSLELFKIKLIGFYLQVKAESSDCEDEITKSVSEWANSHPKALPLSVVYVKYLALAGDKVAQGILAKIGLWPPPEDFK